MRDAVSDTIHLSIDNGTRRTQLGARRTAAAHPWRNTAPKHHHFNMGTATRTEQARLSKFRQRDPNRTVWNAISNATQWSVDNATRKKFGTHGICRRMQRKMTRPEVARYLTIATSAPQAPGSQKEQHRVKRHAQNTRATFRSHFRLRKAQHLSIPTIDTHHSHRSKPQHTVDNLRNLRVSKMRVHRNRAERRLEHNTLVNRQSDPQNAAWSPQNGRGAPGAQRSS